MDLFSKITGKRNYSSSPSDSSEVKTDFNQIQNTNHFSTSSINADNSLYNSRNSKSSQSKKYQSSSSSSSSNSNFKDSNQFKNHLTPNDGQFEESNDTSLNLLSQVLPSSIACCWKLIAVIFALIFVSILIISCFKICKSNFCCCLTCCRKKRPPSPVPMTVSSITASHSLLETNTWEK